MDDTFDVVTLTRRLRMHGLGLSTLIDQSYLKMMSNTTKRRPAQEDSNTINLWKQ